MADLVARSDAGIVAGDESAVAIADAVSRLWESSDQGAACGKRGRAFAKAELSWEAVATRMSELYQPHAD